MILQEESHTIGLLSIQIEKYETYTVVTIFHRSLKLILWDTCGQERYMSICRSYYRGCEAVLFVYDVTNFRSFMDLENWMADFEEYSKGSVNYYFGVSISGSSKIEL